MATARGVAPVFSVIMSNITVGTGALRPTGGSMDIDATRDEAMVAGECEVEVYSNHVRRISIDFYPAGATEAAAHSANNFDAGVGQKFLPGKALTISDSEDVDMNRGWIIDRARKQFRTDGHAVWTVDLHAYLVNGAAMATTEITL